jgi:branched-chain amino acid transport system substrate-binding protein
MSHCSRHKDLSRLVIHSFFCLALLTSILLAGSSEAQESKDIKIGAFHPLTGFLARGGNQIKEGIDMAVEEINGAGGIKSQGGAKLIVLHSDSQGKAEVGQAEAERLIQDGVTTLMGCFQSNVTFNATQIAEREKVPFLVTVAVADDVTARGFKYTFRVQPAQTATIKTALDGIKFLREKTGQSLKTAVFMHEDSIFGTGLADLAKGNGAKYGITVLDTIAYSLKGLTDLTTEVARAKALKPDILFASGYMNDGILMVRTARELRLDIKCIYGIMHGALGEPEFAQKVGDLSEGIFSAGLHWNPVKPEVIELIKRYQAKYNAPFSYLAAYGYQVAYVLADALERAKSKDRNAVRDAIAKTNYKDHIMPYLAPISFNDRGECPSAQILLMQILGGKETPVWPEKFSTAQPILPMPGWVKR